jgi:hypothetical protein
LPLAIGHRLTTTLGVAARVVYMNYGVISKGVNLATKSKTRGHQKQECKFAAYKLQVTTNSYTMIKIPASGLM